MAKPTKKPVRVKVPPSRKPLASTRPKPKRIPVKAQASKPTAHKSLASSTPSNPSSPKSLPPSHPSATPVSSPKKRGRPRSAQSPKWLAIGSQETVTTDDVARGSNTPQHIDMGLTTAEKKQARVKYQRAQASRYNAKAYDAGRDIYPIDFSSINWDRRLSCEKNLQLFSTTYMKSVFYEDWSKDQIICLRKAQDVWIKGGMFALAMPRGGGKTAICRSSILWGTAFAHKTFPYFIGSAEPNALQSLEFVKTYWNRSRELREDFPELAIPISRLNNSNHLAKGQTYRQFPTHISWGAETLRYPCLLLSYEDCIAYGQHCPDFLTYVPQRNPSEEIQVEINKLITLRNSELFRKQNLRGEAKQEQAELLEKVRLYDHPPTEPGTNNPFWLDRWMTKNAGIQIVTAGVEGSIRGEADIHPITLEQPRPDLVLLDDVQKDSKAESIVICDKLIRLIDGAISGLAPPGHHIAALMPCTVIREGDVADTYLDRSKKPEWMGERCSMVIQWPPGITDRQISLETKAGILWNQYDEIRRESLRLHEDTHLATDFYAANRAVMDDGFIVSWEGRYNKDISSRSYELSAQQHAMNLRMKSPETFPAEFQNQGHKGAEGEILISAAQLAAKTVAVDRNTVPIDAPIISAFIDVQDEILFYAVLAVSNDYTGCFIDYGTWPQVDARYFTKSQTSAWSHLTREFFRAYPDYRDKAIKTDGGKVRAPLEAKIYYALSVAVPWLFNKRFAKLDQFNTEMRVARLAIDARWGQASDCIRRYIRESGNDRIIPYYGQPFPPTNKQIEEYVLTDGWQFEHQRHPVKSPKWIIRPNPDGTYYLAADVNRLKDFLFARLASPPGSPGSISLYNATADKHEMFASHVCNSEFPEPVSARGITKNMWQERTGRPDNDYLDCSCGCIAVASTLGACLRTGGELVPSVVSQQPSLSDLYQQKRGREARNTRLTR